MLKFHELNNLVTSAHSLALETSTRAESYQPVSPVIALTTNFHRSAPDIKLSGTRYVYTRLNHPGFRLLEKQLAQLHGGGQAAVFASGMAAISAVMCSLSYPGATILCSDEVYFEVNECLASLAKLAGVKTVTVDICDTEATLVAAAKISDLCLVYLESANNPSSRMADLPAIAAGLKQLQLNVPVVVDNTWLSPILYRPLQHGADIVIESATKYISGRGDVILGAVISSSTHHIAKQRNKQILHWRTMHGSAPSPFNCWMVSKAIETLPLRMERVCSSAATIATALERVPCVTRVLHPGLPSHPSYARAQQLLGKGKAGVVTFHLPLEMEAARMLPSQVMPIISATSYGDSHALLQRAFNNEASSALYPGDSTAGVPDVAGFWFRLAIGLQPPEETLRALLVGLSRCLTVPLGSVRAVYGSLGVVDIDCDQNKPAPQLIEGDLLVRGNNATSSSQIAFYEVLEASRLNQADGQVTLTVRVPAGLKPGMRVRMFRRAVQR